MAMPSPRWHSITSSCPISRSFQKRPSRRTKRPPLWGSYLDYSDGLRLICEPSKLLLRELSPKGPGGESRIYAIAGDYASAFSIPDYTSLEVSWLLAVEQANAWGWLIDTFIPNERWKLEPHPLVQANPWLVFSTAGGAQCNLWMNAGNDPSDEKKEVVQVSCTFHQAGPFSLDVLKARLNECSERKKELVEILGAMGLL